MYKIWTGFQKGFSVSHLWVCYNNIYIYICVYVIHILSFSCLWLNVWWFRYWYITISLYALWSLPFILHMLAAIFSSDVKYSALSVNNLNIVSIDFKLMIKQLQKWTTCQPLVCVWPCDYEVFDNNVVKIIRFSLTWTIWW